MNEQEVFRYVDQSLDGRVPNSPLPIDDLLRDGKAAQRRKSRRSVIGAAALTVLAIGAGAFVQQAIAGGDGQEPANNIASVDVPKASEGMRLVGMGRVVVAVPSSWGTEQTRCGQPTEDTVYFNTNGRDCLVDQSDISSLLLTSLDSGNGQEITRGLALTAQTLNGVDVLMGDSCPPNAACKYPFGTVLVVPSADVAMRISGPMDEEPLFKQIVDSVQLLSDGYTTVPYVVGRPNGPVGNQLLGLGLVPDLVDIGPGRSGRATVTSTSPEAGSVLHVGETVQVSVNESAVCGKSVHGICITDPLVLPTSEWEPGPRPGEVVALVQRKADLARPR